MAVEFPYVPPGPLLLGNAGPGVVFVKGVLSAPDADGFTGWVQIEQDSESLSAQPLPADLFRVNPGLIEIPVKSRLWYGGGTQDGTVKVWRQHRPLVQHQHYLSQYGTSGMFIVPARARRLQVVDWILEYHLEGPGGAVLSHEVNKPDNWEIEVANALQIRLGFLDPNNHEIRWEIDV